MSMSKNDLKNKYVGFALVRDANGKPRIDDPSTLHPKHLCMMTEAEKEALGLWTGCFGRGADGFKHMTKVDEMTYRAEEPIVAIGEILDGDDVWRVLHRQDMKTGDRIVLTLEN